MSTFQTKDGVEIYYDVQGEGKPLLMVPGWSCSTRFFDKNVEALAKECQVIRMDLRGHGESAKPDHGYRIARFAKDIEELIEHLDLKDLTVLGWSMGASVLWSYLELFGTDRVKKLISVDQSPAQYIGPDWQWGQNGCYDVEAFVRLCADLTYAERANAEGTIHACHHQSPKEEDVQFLADEIMKCPARVKIEIMRDHTNLDWRDYLPQIAIPTLVLVAKNSAVFDWEGSAYVGENVQNGRIEFFENSGHMLFWEEPDRFNQLVAEFVNQ